ncbi:hypothetical protein K491DRAFT_699638 [Lophiostoma macrostomum CBS 122681]|uniref:Uncharacterized protein n=1 Tax=Lophiostoma macrostomum CBS 122681 TaxID=1314788 RepID=A0A6A6SMM6_9PLEO|nr:hypothetical protein K491DRAFT_699638 [Lophiostoma macrostomum CBS 122681]
MRTVSVVALALAALASTVSALINGHVINNCPMTIYARPATCSDTGTETIPIGPGESWTHPQPADNDDCNRAIKLSADTVIDSEGASVYNIEYVQSNDDLWYNLSHDAGNPFTEYARTLTVSSCSESLHCAAGNDGSACDYPMLYDCMNAGDVHFQLC